MAEHRYWRLVGFDTYEGGTLELSEARLYAGGTIVDGSGTLTCTAAPTSGALTDLRDGSTASVVSWSPSKYKTSGFALVFDLTGSGASVDGIKLGSGSSVRTFPYALTLQFSDNGTAWTLYDPIVCAAYPGAFSLSAVGEAGNPSASSNVALLHFDGLNGSTSINDVTGRTWTSNNGASLSTGWAGAFGGSSLRLSGSNWISTPTSPDLEFGDGPFTISLRIYMVTNPGTNHKGIIAKDDTNGATRGWRMMTYVGAQAGFVLFLVSVGGTSYIVRDTVSLSTGTAHHLAVVRDGSGYLRLYKNGVQIDQTAITGTLNSTSFPVNMGALINSGSTVPSSGVNAYIDEVRICKEALYPDGTTFTPPTSQWLDSAPRIMAIDPAAPKSVGKIPVPSSLHVFADAYNGGWGVVSGTVKQKGSPVNTPLRRRVVLIDEQSRATIRETWSDVTTGAYEFRGVKLGVPYTVMAYDYTGAEFPVVADRQYAEALVF